MYALRIQHYGNDTDRTRDKGSTTKGRYRRTKLMIISLIDYWMDIKGNDHLQDLRISVFR